MQVARSHGFDCVLVWKFDRFARSVAHLLKALDEFHHLGIRFISVQDQVDTESPMGKAMFTIIGAMAELESSLISERVKAGMEAARVRGKRLALQRYSDTSRTYAPNTRICGYIKGRFLSSLATAKPRFYVGKFGQPTKVTL
jgi:DNA invertase Pin-like site-specific DNA recombinase